MDQAVSVIFDAPGLLVINKPSGHALLADRSGASDLWTELQARYGKLYLVHRLDKGTSGVLLVATDQATQRRLTKLFSERAVDKYYLAQVHHAFPAKRTYAFELPLCKGRKSRYRVAGPRDHIELQNRVFSVTPDREGVDAHTLARLVSQVGERSWLALKPTTGRTHQLRVHLSWTGFPICGDHLYGPKDNAASAPRLMLHCRKLVVPGYPAFKAPYPEAWSLK